MRLLADENFPRPTIEVLRAQGHDVTWVRTDFPGAKDSEILRRAIAEKRIVLTLDKDFRHLAVRESEARDCGVILFRIHPAVPERVTPLVLAVLTSRSDWTRHFSVVTAEGIHMVRLGT
jgi:predicted nuclease of predicted toxin-antitoxin system